MSKESPRILVIDEAPERAAILVEGLREAGYADVVQLAEMTDLVARIATIDPDAILIDLENPRRDTIEQMFRISREVKRPIAMFVDESDPETIAEAVRAGVSAYIVDGMKSERLRPVVQLAIERFKAYQALEQRAVAAETALEERKLVERAKGIVMKRRGVGEEEAHRLLQQAARQNGRRTVDIARSIITAAEVGV